MKHSVIVSVALALSLLCPTRAAAWPLLAGPVPDVPKDRSGGCAEAAKQYAAGKYAEAAALYEGCARASGEAGLWKKAGMARYSARQYAHAIQALGGYPRAAAGDAEDGPIVAMLRDAQAQCVTVRFAVTAAAGAPRPEQLVLVPQTGDASRDAIVVPWSRSTVALDVWLDPGAWTASLVLPGDARVGPQAVTVARTDGAPQPVEFRVEAPRVATPEPPQLVVAPPVEVAVTVGPAAALRQEAVVAWTGPRSQAAQATRTATTRWDLTPGTWTLQVKAPRFTTVTRMVEVVGPSALTLTLSRTREDRARIGLTAATGGAVLGLVIGGLVAAIGGGKDYKAAASGLADATDRRASIAATTAGIERTSTGTIVLGSGVGAGVAAVTVAADGSDPLLGAEVGVGLALVVAGVAWLVPAKRRYLKDSLVQEDDWLADRAFFDEHRRPELVAATLLGIGAGLATGASVALLTRALVGRKRPARKASVTPLTTPRAIGLNFQASF